MQGLEKVGFTLTSRSWLDRFAQESKRANEEDTTLSPLDRFWSGITILIDDLDITDEELREAREAETAIYVVRRNSGENDDRKAEKGDYYLSDQEHKNLIKIAVSFAHTIVILNTCAMDPGFIDQIPGIHGVILMGLADNESGLALANIVAGNVNPSGRLTDTWAKTYTDNPASETFGVNDGDSMQEDYVEDIYVGYRFYDTFDVTPRFPFGYGLSYTSFEMQTEQLYVSAPAGSLGKPYQELKGFLKTDLLEPGEAQEVEISFATGDLASYSEEQAAFVMEAGNYIVRIGANSRQTRPVGMISLDTEAVIRKVENKFPLDHGLTYLQAPVNGNPTEDLNIPSIPLEAAFCPTITACGGISSSSIERQRMEAARADRCATLIDVKEGRVSMEAFVKSLEDEVLVRLVTGNANETPYSVPSRVSEDRKVKVCDGPKSSGATTALFVDSLAIPNWLLTDGPAGLHLPMCESTSNPVGMVIAQTWNEAAIEEVGKMLAKELAFYKYSVILGPGMNIHRDPLCGRNFEYFSEDPFLTGKMGAAFTKGIQSYGGTAVSMKHFACNNQEADRTETNATVSERALREIYLKGFEICVKEAKPRTVMTSYNRLNGVHTSSNYALLTKLLRDEWGFDGVVMTDWGTKSDKTEDLHAGNDLIMGGYSTQPLVAAMCGSAPEFAKDGYVVTDVFEVYGGFMKQVVEHWNVFAPSAEGKDFVSTSVAPGVELNAKIGELVEQGVARVETVNGETHIEYRGTNRGAYLSRLDVQICASHVLREIMNSQSYTVMTQDA